MELLKGAAVTMSMQESLSKTLSTFCKPVHLAVIRIGEKKDDVTYERNARKRMEALGIHFTSYIFPLTITQEDFFSSFQSINENPSIHGILLLRPLPPQIEEKTIANAINPIKDVDGISPINIAKVFSNQIDGFAPCTAESVMQMLFYSQIPLSGKHIVIVGRSLVVGKPLSSLLLNQDATITICHSKTKDLPALCKTADILIACAGRPRMINSSYVKENAVLIDVGINVDENNKLCGDVDLDTITQASLATPVPGGVGAVTTYILAKHVIKAAQLLEKKI